MVYWSISGDVFWMAIVKVNILRFCVQFNMMLNKTFKIISVACVVTDVYVWFRNNFTILAF